MSRDLQVAFEGRHHTIPEICLIGWQQGARSRGEPSSVPDFIRWWDFNTQLSVVEALAS